ncbi:MAG: hypothetical protein K0S56_1500 [Microvirga sp.]|nr:hypothetical protein [Microvirga sp.]
MTKTQPKRHHWWPECVSKHWADQAGGVHWILPDGEVRRAKPASFGVIGNGHFIKMGDGAEQFWRNNNYESEFQKADDAFPRLISWLDDLDRAGPPFERQKADRIIRQSATEAEMALLFGSLVSLAIRSPMHRERSVSQAEYIRGTLPERERNILIGANMQRAQRVLTEKIGGRGKALVIFSPEREFIFGDGFFHNIYPPAEHIRNLTMLVPLTPWISVLYTTPRAYRVEPRLATMVVNIAEAEDLNSIVQIYAKRMLFYRSEPPIVSDAFRRCEHLVYDEGHNPVDTFVELIPGIYPIETF